MSSYKSIIDEETAKVLEYAKQIANLEINFRKYISEKGLSEDSYKLASSEYSNAIIPIKQYVEELEKTLDDMNEDTEYVSSEMRDELNKELGRIWRIITANKKFVNEYGGVSFTDEPAEKLYKEIYDKHLEEANEFMYNFIKVANILFSK